MYGIEAHKEKEDLFEKKSSEKENAKEGCQLCQNSILCPGACTIRHCPLEGKNCSNKRRRPTEEYQ